MLTFHMEQIPLFQARVLSISDVTRYLKALLESDEVVQDVWVQGEVSNLSRPASGHVYFTLKDAGASLRCVMWRNTALRFTSMLRDGLSVEAHGGVSIYEAGGQYQLYVDALRPVGEGALWQEFLRLKSQLEGEGLFAVERKRPLPMLPRHIGIVTSPTGAALQDMLNVLRRRYPLVQVTLAPTAVQGAEAPAGIVTALRRLNCLADPPEVIILARGGGSVEDLWAFNDESVARAIAASVIPVVSGVGHETDFTIADFIADVRAPTPTAAAELITPDREDLLMEIQKLQMRLHNAMLTALAEYRRTYTDLMNRIGRSSPLRRVRQEQQRVDDLSGRMIRAIGGWFVLRRARLQMQTLRLGALSPLAVLERGYSIVQRAEDGSVVRSAGQVQPGESIFIRLGEGKLAAEVTDINTPAGG